MLKSGPTVLAVIAIMLFSGLIQLPAFSRHVSFASQNPISVANISWVGGVGIPGDVDALLNVTIQNLNSFAIYGITEQLNLSSTPLDNLSGGVIVNSFIGLQLSPGQAGSSTFPVNIPGSVSTGDFAAELSIDYSSTSGSANQTQSILIPVKTPNQLMVTGESWSGSMGTPNGGFPGDRGDVLNLRITNTNQFSITSLLGEIDLNPQEMSNVSGGVLALSNESMSQSVLPDQSQVLSFVLNISPNATIGELPISLSLNYQDLFSATVSQTAQVSVTIYGLALATLVEVNQDTEMVGVSTVSFVVRNVGAAAMYSPAVKLRLPSSLVVTANFTTPTNLPQINPGGSETFSFNITAAAGATIATYPGTVLVTYDDQFGDPRNASFAVQITVVGTIDLVIQDEQIVQNIANVTVTGLIVNYGTAEAILTEAYGYMNKTGSLNQSLGSGSSYLGTISSKAPAFFSVVIPYSIQPVSQSVTLTIVFEYQNATRQISVVSNTTSFLLLGSKQLPQPPGRGQELAIGVGVSAVVIVAVVVSLFFYLRRRKGVNGHRETP
jgi:hypothetical protein